MKYKNFSDSPAYIVLLIISLVVNWGLVICSFMEKAK
jgi:hypothetical protein